MDSLIMQNVGILKHLLMREIDKRFLKSSFNVLDTKLTSGH